MTDSLLLNRAEVRARHILSHVFPYGADFPLHIAALVRELGHALSLPESSLDRTIHSLGVLELAISQPDIARSDVRALFPNLVAYMGEVLIECNGGSWYMLWRPDYAVWEPYVVTDSGEFCDPFTHLYDQLADVDEGFSLLTAISRMTEDAGL